MRSGESSLPQSNPTPDKQADTRQAPRSASGCAAGLTPLWRVAIALSPIPHRDQDARAQHRTPSGFERFCPWPAAALCFPLVMLHANLRNHFSLRTETSGDTILCVRALSSCFLSHRPRGRSSLAALRDARAELASSRRSTSLLRACSQETLTLWATVANQHSR